MGENVRIRRVAVGIVGILTTTTLALSGCSAPANPTAAVLAPVAQPEAPQPPPTAQPVPAASPIPEVEPEPYDRMRIKVTRITPNSGKYGVGIPIIVTFNKPVPKRYRDEVERLVTVESSTYIPQAAWSWTESDTMVLRSKDFWPAYTTLTVDANLDGKEIIDDKRRMTVRLVGGADITVRVGRELISRVNGKTHQMKVYRNGEHVKTMPTSLGKPGFVTRSGIKVIHEGYEAKRMTSQALGLTDETYDLIAPYALRLTPTGEFVHGAPWALGRLGRTNGSHGCTNLSVSDAKWFYDASRMGDPVITKGTGRPMESWNGWGGPWNVDWAAWLDGSRAGEFALGQPPAPDPPHASGLLPVIPSNPQRGSETVAGS